MKIPDESTKAEQVLAEEMANANPRRLILIPPFSNPRLFLDQPY